MFWWRSLFFVPPPEIEKKKNLWFDWLTCSIACASVKAKTKRKVTDKSYRDRKYKPAILICLLNRRRLGRLDFFFPIFFDSSSSSSWWPTCPRTYGDLPVVCLEARFLALVLFSRERKKTCAPWIHDELPFRFFFFLKHRRRRWFIRRYITVTNNNNWDFRFKEKDFGIFSIQFFLVGFLSDKDISDILIHYGFVISHLFVHTFTFYCPVLDRFFVTFRFISFFSHLAQTRSGKCCEFILSLLFFPLFFVVCVKTIGIDTDFRFVWYRSACRQDCRQNSRLVGRVTKYSKHFLLKFIVWCLTWVILQFQTCCTDFTWARLNVLNIFSKTEFGRITSYAHPLFWLSCYSTVNGPLSKMEIQSFPIYFISPRLDLCPK